MFFKNLTLFRLEPAFITAFDLEEQLGRGEFRPCAPHEAMTRGWVRNESTGQILRPSTNSWFFTLAIESRLLPSSVINQEVAKRAAAIEKDQGYKPGRKQLKELRERVAEELLPQAFTKKTCVQVWIDYAAGWLGINATGSKAEAVIEHLRQCLDEFPLQLLKTKLSPTAAMADWLAGGEGPAGFTIDRDCALKAVGEEKSEVRFLRHTLEGDDIKDHLAAGKLPTKLALTYNDRVSFVLTDAMTVKRIAFLDLAVDEAHVDMDTQEEQADADHALMAGEFNLLALALVEALGGEAVAE